MLINAIEHGNLGIGYSTKTSLMKTGIWEQEVLRRQNLPQNQRKKAEVFFRRKADRIELTISDQGEGFDWEKYLEISPSRARDMHGRGIALAKMLSFDDISYEGPGNIARATIKV